MTPEGLNTRLTFLQQCMRPGDTIPTIKDVGGATVLQYNNATNTSFGAPPVLVLRVGDFYNTKIIPTSLAFTYEDLDLNPEGIGVQPMIANVTLSFNFVGGSGLKESIDKLQNALTFNYYANTEIYDDRADVTAKEQFLDVLDKEFLAQAPPPSPPALNQAAPNAGQSNNSTIGSIVSSNIGADYETGTIQYGDFMNGVVTQTQTYFTNIVNKNKEILAQYNNAMRQEWMISRNYFGGKIKNATGEVQIFGKPTKLQERIDTVFAALQKDVDNGDEGFIKFISAKSKQFSPRLIRTVQTNYINFLKDKKTSYLTPIFKIVQDLTNIEQTYINTLGRMNTIVFGNNTNTSGTDGLQQKNGKVRLYITTGTDKVSKSSVGNPANTLIELENDVDKIKADLIEYNNIINSDTSFIYTGDKSKYTSQLVFPLQTNGVTNLLKTENVFNPFSSDAQFENLSFRRVYMILSQEVIDLKKYETFKKAIIGNIIGNQAIIGKNSNDDIDKQFDAYWLGVRPLFKKEDNITKEFIDNLEKDKLKKYLTYVPFDKKERLFTFTTQITDTAIQPSQENLIKGLGATTNQNTNKLTWNDTNGNNEGAYISKAKLN
jgi:hypothetical protein